MQVRAEELITEQWLGALSSLLQAAAGMLATATADAAGGRGRGEGVEHIDLDDQWPEDPS